MYKQNISNKINEKPQAFPQVGRSDLADPVLAAGMEKELKNPKEKQKGHNFMDFSHELFVFVAVIRPSEEEGEIDEGEEEKGVGKIGELVINEIKIAVRFNVVGFEI